MLTQRSRAKSLGHGHGHELFENGGMDTDMVTACNWCPPNSVHTGVLGTDLAFGRLNLGQVNLNQNFCSWIGYLFLKPN